MTSQKNLTSGLWSPFVRQRTQVVSHHLLDSVWGIRVDDRKFEREKELTSSNTGMVVRAHVGKRTRKEQG